MTDTLGLEHVLVTGFAGLSLVLVGTFSPAGPHELAQLIGVALPWVALVGNYLTRRFGTIAEIEIGTDGGDRS